MHPVWEKREKKEKKSPDSLIRMCNHRSQITEPNANDDSTSAKAKSAQRDGGRLILTLGLLVSLLLSHDTDQAFLMIPGGMNCDKKSPPTSGRHARIGPNFGHCLTLSG